MSTTNPYIKSDTGTKTYTGSEYSPENYFAQVEWNKEIANNKQGYMAVDIMSMKDFYDAGGYSFIDDYRNELGQIDAAYDRAQVGYGVKGEQMAKAGLTGSGYSDYLDGQAYAGRVAGQAKARQNAMANSNSFRAAYNQYVEQQKAKREQNLNAVIERAQSVNMNPENFVGIATKLGIPQADAERGKDMLIAYYQGTGMMPPDQSGATGTDGSTSGSSWMTTAQQQTVTEMTENLKDSITGATDKDGNVIIPKAPTLDAALSNLYGTAYNKNDPVVQKAIEDLRTNQIINVTAAAQRGAYGEAKAYLDELADFGLFGDNGKESEQYKSSLAKMQEMATAAIIDAYKSGKLKSYESVLTNLGYKDITGENAEELMYQALTTLEESNIITTAQRKTIEKVSLAKDFNQVKKEEEFEKIIWDGLANNLNPKDIVESMGAIEVKRTYSIWTGNKISITLSNGTTVKYKLEDNNGPYPTDEERIVSEKVNETGKYNKNDILLVNDEIYIKTGSDWRQYRAYVYAEDEQYSRFKEVIKECIPQENIISLKLN